MCNSANVDVPQLVFELHARPLQFLNVGKASLFLVACVVKEILKKFYSNGSLLQKERGEGKDGRKSKTGWSVDTDDGTGEKVEHGCKGIERRLLPESL